MSNYLDPPPSTVEIKGIPYPFKPDGLGDSPTLKDPFWMDDKGNGHLYGHLLMTQNCQPGWNTLYVTLRVYPSGSEIPFYTVVGNYDRLQASLKVSSEPRGGKFRSLLNHHLGVQSDGNRNQHTRVLAILVLACNTYQFYERIGSEDHLRIHLFEKFLRALDEAAANGEIEGLPAGSIVPSSLVPGDKDGYFNPDIFKFWRGKKQGKQAHRLALAEYPPATYRELKAKRRKTKEEEPTDSQDSYRSISPPPDLLPALPSVDSPVPRVDTTGRRN